ncbi:MAG TPA: hypothetical protein DCZ10_13185 [Pelotomaculum sp.]|nr:hypothetical protein [Pelotomaculum sp.]
MFIRYHGRPRIGKDQQDDTVFTPIFSPSVIHAPGYRLRQNIAGTRIELDDNAITVTVSLGVAGVDKAGDIELDELLKNADEALYEAKEAGRNCVRRRVLKQQ